MIERFDQVKTSASNERMGVLRRGDYYGSGSQS